MKEYKISMKGLSVTVKAANLEEAQEKAQEKAVKKGKDKTILWVEPQGETRILYCSVCSVKPAQPGSKTNTCYDCTDHHK